MAFFTISARIQGVKVQAMKSTALFLLLLTFSMATVGEENRKIDAEGHGTDAMCAAAAPKLREFETNEVVLIMIIDDQGKVQSFETESPKGLRLEKMKEAKAEIKAMRFEPAKLHGQPVKVRVRVGFDCSRAVAMSRN